MRIERMTIDKNFMHAAEVGMYVSLSKTLTLFLTKIFYFPRVSIFRRSYFFIIVDKTIKKNSFTMPLNSVWTRKLIIKQVWIK